MTLIMSLNMIFHCPSECYGTILILKKKKKKTVENMENFEKNLEERKQTNKYIHTHKQNTMVED